MPTMETVINPFKETVSVITYDHFDGDFDDYRKIIEARMLTFVRLYENGDGVYLDDEGLYADNRYFWMHANYPQPLVNIGVFVGTDQEGDTIPPRTSLTQFNKDVVFIGSHYQLALYTRVNSELIDDSNGYEDYRNIFFNKDAEENYYASQQ